MYYVDLFKLCGWEDQEIWQERSRIDDVFGILGITSEDVRAAEGRVREGYDIELTGIRKILGVWIRALIDLVLSRKEKNKIIYYSFPSLGGLGFTTSVIAGKENMCVCPEWILIVTLGSIFDKAGSVLKAAEETAMAPGKAFCSLVQMRLGAMVKGIIPLPDCLLTSGFLCDVESKADEWIHETYNVPWIVTDNVLDSPWGEFPEIKAERVYYLGAEINRTLDQIYKVIEKKPTTDDWSTYVAAHHDFLEKLRTINKCMRADPQPTSVGGIELVRLCRNAMTYNLFPQALEGMEVLGKELVQNVSEGKGVVPKGAPRVFGCFLPKVDNRLIRMTEAAGIATPVTYLTYEGTVQAWTQASTYSTWSEMRADAELKRGLFHSTYGIYYFTREGCRSWDVDGVVWSWPFSCRPFAITSVMYKKLLEEELGIPVLSLEMDLADNRAIGAEALRTRLETFAEVLLARKQKAGRIRQK